MLVPVILVGQKPTSQRLMRLVGLHASMTTPVSALLWCGPGSSGSFLGGMKVGDICPPLEAASEAVSEDSGCGRPSNWRQVAIYTVRAGGRVSVCCSMTLAHKALPQGGRVIRARLVTSDKQSF